MSNIILMAGKSQRFADAGYKLSKPLLPVSGKPMIVRAVESMPPSDGWVFVVRQEHLEEKEVIATLKSVAPNVTVMVDPSPTGQLNSCLVAKAHYDSDKPMFVGACDFGMVYDKVKYAELMSGSDAPDMLVWSFTQQPNLTRNPQAWGWLKQDKDLNIHGVSVKIPVSDDPFNDHAICGSFSFKSGKTFLKIADELVRRGVRVKGEFYIDSMIGLAVEMGYRVVSFPVQYIGWGVPADYEEYLWWEKAIANPGSFPEAQQKNEYAFWKRYFDSQNM
jgi:dTDP-glucose pyrophosphorylase